MKRWWWVFCAAFLAAGCAEGGLGRWPLPDVPICARVTAVLDGDTLEAVCSVPPRGLESTQITVRFMYIDTLETSDNPRMERTLSRSRKVLGFMTREEYLSWGEAAKTNLAALAPVGSTVEIDTPAERVCDDYGRVLGLVWAGSTNLNLRQVEQGLAFTYFLETERCSWTRYYHRQFALAERSAMSQGKGFWSVRGKK